jgi:hypothetical protein
MPIGESLFETRAVAVKDLVLSWLANAMAQMIPLECY